MLYENTNYGHIEGLHREAFRAYCKKLVGLAWFALCYRYFPYCAGGEDVCHVRRCLEILLITTSIFCDLMHAKNVGEGPPKTAGDTKGPSSRRDEDHPVLADCVSLQIMVKLSGTYIDCIVNLLHLKVIFL
jgi:hypothetical protein